MPGRQLYTLFCEENVRVHQCIIGAPLCVSVEYALLNANPEIWKILTSGVVTTLRSQGIKVLLSVLGNHDLAGAHAQLFFLRGGYGGGGERGGGGCKLKSCCEKMKWKLLIGLFGVPIKESILWFSPLIIL